MKPVAVSADGFSIGAHAVAYPGDVWRGFGPGRELGEELARLLETRELRPAEAHALPATDEAKAVVALTMGKDSLASVVVGRAMGLDLAAAYVCHPTLSGDFRARQPQLEALGRRLAMPVHTARDDTMALAPPVHGPAVESLRTAAYALLLLPFASRQGARYLTLGNGFEFNGQADSLQSAEGMSRLDAWIAAWTGGAVRVTSLIHALHPVACHKLVHGVRPEVGLHQVSCRRAGEVRWCEDCATCAQNYLFVRAMGRDPASLGFTRSMLDERSARHFSSTGDEHALAAHLARRGGDDSFVVRRLLERHAALDVEAAARRYLQPADAAVALPLAGRSTQAARRLLA